MKSPFIVEQDFLSPHLCEDIVDYLNFSPDYDKDNKPVSSIKYNEDLELVIFENIQNIITKFENHYSIQYKGTSKIEFNYHPHGFSSAKLITDNSKFINNQWKRINNNDFTGIIFLSDYNDKPPFSDEFEVYGGKLEFRNHKFGFNPQRGTLILFPSDPHFSYIFSPIYAGDLFFIKFNITCFENFVYNRLQYLGNYLTWFNDIA